ncbi:MAG: GIY-YIG nuclease family protein [Methylophaga sp.]|nr:GIY-YIG nuclease family protein [Methylophaga sp.]
MTKNDWTLYIIEAENGHLYTGITTDLDRRLDQHQSGRGGAKFFHSSAVKQLVYQENHPDRGSASRREAAIKKLSRQDKLQLIGDALKQV